MTDPSAPALAMTGSVGWNSTASTPSRAFSRWLVISCTHARVPRMSQKRTEQSWLPDTREKPAASNETEDTVSRCARIECVHCPVINALGEMSEDQANGRTLTCSEVKDPDVLIFVTCHQ